MFIGHFALGLAAKRAAPRVPLSVLFVAAQFADLLWPLLVALGVEDVRIAPGITAVTPLDFVSYPYSHSLLLLVVWGLLFGVVYRLLSGDRRALPILAALVVSHWFLDYATHRPDMPLYPGSARFGLGLWNSLPGTLVTELLLYGVGIWVYMRTTKARDRIGRWAFVSMTSFMAIVYLGSMSGPPPSVAAIWITGLAGGGILLAWSHWADDHRVASGPVNREKRFPC
jgi:membrane-bound metal-dependent hydrolase YbcI (DUF457 family)